MSVRSTDGNSLFFATGIDNSGLQSGVNKAVGVVRGMASAIGKINPFGALALLASVTFGAISREAYQLAKNFENAMKEVETISKATQENFKGISKAVFELSNITPDNPEKLANAYYQIVSAGYDGAKGLKLLETASKAAVGGVTDTQTAADGLTTVLNAFGIEAENVSEVADVMFKTVQLGKTTFSELASNLSTVAPIASSSGIRFEEVAAAIATLTKQGVPTAQAMTQIRSAIIGTNEVLGDGWSKTLSLQNAFELLYEKAGGSQTVLQEMVGRIEAVSGVLGVAGKNAKGAAKDLQEMTNATGASEEAFKRMASSNVNQLAILQNRIKVTTKDIGEAILGASNEIVGFLNKALEDSKALKKSFDQQRTALFRMKNALENTNTSEEERSKIIGDINSKYKDYLEGINAEKLSNEQLLTVLDKVNDAYVLRYQLKKRQNKLTEALRKQADLKDEFDNYGKNLQKQIERLQVIADDNGIDLKVNTSLSDEEILKSIRKQLKGVEGALEVKGGKFIRLGGFAGESIEVIDRLINKRKQVNHELEKQTQLIKQLTDENKNFKKTYLNTKDGETLAIQLINQTKSLEKLRELREYLTRENLVKALGFKESILVKLNKINTDKNAKNIAKYLQDENQEIRQAAKERLKILNTDFSFSLDKDNEGTTYKDILAKKREQYEEYENYITTLGKEEADKRFENLLQESESYAHYLQNQLEKFREFQDKKDAIVEAAAQSGVSLKPREKIKPIEIKPAYIDVNFKIDTTSLNAINNRIKKLYDDLYKARSDKERKLINQKIEAEQKKLGAAIEASRTELQINRDEVSNFSRLSNKKLKIEIDYWKKRLSLAKKGSDAAIEAEENIADAQAQIGANISNTIYEITGILGEASALFRKFGDEDMTQFLEQLEGIAEGAATIAMGATPGGNPLLIAQGALQVLNSALTVEVVSDTAKFEEAIKELEKAIDKLDYVISKSVGEDKISSRKDAIKELEELQRQADKAKDAELNARKEIKLLGIRIGKKGTGSGTDLAKLEELDQKAKDAKRKVQELNEELDQLYTGATEMTIVDSIISGLKEGKKSVKDFADNFRSLMQEAMLQSFQRNFLDKEVKKFYEKFAKAGSDSKYTADEIKALQNLYSQLISGTKNNIEAINQILEDTDIGSIGSENDRRTGLAGGISKITEDTANILAGTINNIRIDIENGLEIAEQNLTYLSQIAQNTSYNRHLESMDVRLSNIETLLS